MNSSPLWLRARLCIGFLPSCDSWVELHTRTRTRTELWIIVITDRQKRSSPLSHLPTSAAASLHGILAILLYDRATV